MKQPLRLSRKPFSLVPSFFVFIICLSIFSSCGQRNQRRPLINLGETEKPSPEDGVLAVRDELYSWLEEAVSEPLIFPEERELMTYDIVYRNPKKISFRVTGSNLFCKGHFRRASVSKKFLEGYLGKTAALPNMLIERYANKSFLLYPISGVAKIIAR